MSRRSICHSNTKIIMLGSILEKKLNEFNVSEIKYIYPEDYDKNERVRTPDGCLWIRFIPFLRGDRLNIVDEFFEDNKIHFIKEFRDNNFTNKYHVGCGTCVDYHLSFRESRKDDYIKENKKEEPVGISALFG